jgi:heme exporter protein A
LFGLDDIEDRIVSIADNLRVSPWLGKRVGTLSHGLKKRLSIVRVLLHNPQILLMDEPETGLDQEAVSILDEIIESRVNDGKSVLITTHSFERGLSIGDRLAILAQGEIPYQAEVNSVSGLDSLQEIYSRFTGSKL